ncbi:MAG: hypothetical protein Q8N09_12800, partial [Thermodesulfovibrionia bacterium]|nr:hypothetical protein [Thermodesulfovibrionia bacterium]
MALHNSHTLCLIYPKISPFIKVKIEHLRFLTLHNFNLLRREVVELVDHLINLSFVFFDLGLFFGVIKIISIFGDGEDLVKRVLFFSES